MLELKLACFFFWTGSDNMSEIRISYMIGKAGCQRDEWYALLSLVGTASVANVFTSSESVCTVVTKVNFGPGNTLRSGIYHRIIFKFFARCLYGARVLRSNVTTKWWLLSTHGSYRGVRGHRKTFSIYPLGNNSTHLRTFLSSLLHWEPNLPACPIQTFARQQR